MKNGEIKKQAEDAVKEVLREKTITDKLLYWTIFKVSYHTTFIYHFVKGLILRRW